MAEVLTTDSADLAAMFGIEIEGVDSGDATALMCPKCHGGGSFIGHNGRRIGNCFACDGTGLARTAGVALALDACPKCAGTGEYSADRPCFACAGTGKAAAIREVDADASKIAAAFAAAMAHGIKRPRLRLDTFKFSRAPDTGRNAGSIYVTEAGEYLGRITAGRFVPTRACDDPTRDRVAAVAADPHRAAKAYGQRTGSCACCGRELTNAESIALNIGPICRDKYGWA